jgi:hypothetical protein
MFLDEFIVAEENDPDFLDHLRFNKYYMMRNRPVVVRGMAAKWGAT